MNDLIVWATGWDDDGNKRLASTLLNMGVPNVDTHCDFTKHEPDNYNVCIKESIARGFKYAQFIDSDVEVPHRETILALYNFIASTSDAGSVRPWRSGETPMPYQVPSPWYVDDNTAMMFRLDIGVFFDEEFLFTGWSDLDFGSEIEFRGYKNYNDRRWPVMHNLARSRGHTKSTCLQAMKKRNKLIVDYKWWWCGRENWRGVESFNSTIPVEKRIPTMQQIVSMSNEDQHTLAESIDPEHTQIYRKDQRWPNIPNLAWLNPLIVGYSTRERFRNEYGYG